MERWRHMAEYAGWQAGIVWFMLAPIQAAEPAGAARPADRIAAQAGDELFSQRTSIPRLKIEIPPEGMAVLRQYSWRRDEGSASRTDVRATVREGDVVYTNVAVHLKGSAGSFRPIDSEKPALTLNF